jgi:hypothetical protein
MSGRKNVLAPYHLVQAGDMSGNITSAATNIQYLDNVGVQFNWTGTPTGSFYVEVSLDKANWTALSLSPAPAASGAAGTWYCDLQELSSPWIRVRYAASSGSGTLDVYVGGKAI